MPNYKRCPFCGGEAKEFTVPLRIGGYSRGVHRIYIACDKCSCRTMEFDWDDRIEMIAIWNKRTVIED